jgi:hypothetical protein
MAAEPGYRPPMHLGKSLLTAVTTLRFGCAPLVPKEVVQGDEQRPDDLADALAWWQAAAPTVFHRLLALTDPLADQVL